MRYIDLFERYSDGMDSTVTHDGVLYDLNKIIFLSEQVPVLETNLQDLAWMYDGSEYTEDDVAREQQVDLSFPIIVTPWKNKIVIVDGFHRVHKAMKEGRTSLPSRSINRFILAMCRINFPSAT